MADNRQTTLTGTAAPQPRSAQSSWDVITAALEHVVGPGRPAGSWTRYCCPVHETGSGHRPSLGIKYDTRDERTVVHCFAGCPDEQVLDAIGLRVRDMFDRKPEHPRDSLSRTPKPRPQQTSAADLAIGAAGLPLAQPSKKFGEQLTAWRKVSSYRYENADGSLAGEVVRKEAQFENGRDKTFTQRRWTGSDWEYEGFDDIPYRLPEVQAAIAAGRTIYLPEGEKDVESARAAGLVATCNAGGAMAWKPAHAQHLRGAATVVIVVDRDATGYRRGERVRSSLDGLVGQVRVVQARTGKDLTDHFALGHEVGELDPVPYLDPLTPTHIQKAGDVMPPKTTDLTIYTTPDCVQCQATKIYFDKMEIDYRIVDLEHDAAARERLKDLGYRTAPIFEFKGSIEFSGFRPDRFSDLVDAILRPEPEPPPTNGPESIDVAAVRQWAAPYLRSAERRGDIPELGSPAWIALPNGDPRKTGAVVQAALRQAAAAPPPAARPSFDQVRQHNSTARAAAAPLASPAGAAPSHSAATAPSPQHLPAAAHNAIARTR